MKGGATDAAAYIPIRECAPSTPGSAATHRLAYDHREPALKDRP